MSGWTKTGAGFILVILVMTGIPWLAPAAGAYGDGSGRHTEIHEAVLVTGTQSPMNESVLAPYRKPPVPVTVIHLETQEKVLPGPRYMAFGPGMIELSLSHEEFSLFIMILGLLAAVWCIRKIGAWGRDGNRQY